MGRLPEGFVGRGGVVVVVDNDPEEDRGDEAGGFGLEGSEGITTPGG